MLIDNAWQTDIFVTLNINLGGVFSNVLASMFTNTWINFFLYVLMLCSQSVHCDLSATYALTSWYTSTSILPTANRGSFIGYDEIANKIWIIGGIACEDCVYSYNIDTNIVTTHTSIIYGGHNRAQTALMIDQSLYYWVHYQGLSKYNTMTENEIFHLFNHQMVQILSQMDPA